jgi:integrase
VLATLCGLRRGEITALRWKAIDLDNGQLAVIASTEQADKGAIREKEAKSGTARTVALPSLAIEELRRWKLTQAQELFKLGVRADEGWHVVTQADGPPLQPRSLTHVMSEFLKEWGVTLHGLRHSHASHMLASDIHPKIVQERLGHSSIAITMDIYSHLMSNMQREAAAAVDSAAGSNRQEPRRSVAKRYENLDLVSALHQIAKRFQMSEGWPSGLRHRS